MLVSLPLVVEERVSTQTSPRSLQGEYAEAERLILRAIAIEEKSPLDYYLLCLSSDNMLHELQR